MISSRNIAGAAGFREPPRKNKERARAIPPQSKISSGNYIFECVRARVCVKYTFLEPRPSTIGEQGPISCELVPCAASMRARTKARSFDAPETFLVWMPLRFSPYFLDI